MWMIKRISCRETELLESGMLPDGCRGVIFYRIAFWGEIPQIDFPTQHAES